MSPARSRRARSRELPTVRVLPTGHPTLTWRIDCSACGDYLVTGTAAERSQADQVAGEHRRAHRRPRRDRLGSLVVLLVGAALLFGLLLLAAYGARP